MDCRMYAQQVRTVLRLPFQARAQMRQEIRPLVELEQFHRAPVSLGRGAGLKLFLEKQRHHLG